MNDSIKISPSPIKKNIHDWLRYIETLSPVEMDLRLERILAVAQKCALNKFKAKVITVAGTNGKGSCVAVMEKILLESDQRVASYTSPHLLCFNERIHINGKEIDDEKLCQAFAFIEEIRGEIPLTFFEFTTLSAFYLFKQTNLDVILLEVGLGGRLDAVNIVDADIAIISSIAFDHMAYLGNDRESIAKEKAGIFRQHQPAVCGDSDPPGIIDQMATQLNMRLHTLGRDFKINALGAQWELVTADNKSMILPRTNLLLSNVATGIIALELLGIKLTQSLISACLLNLSVPGRYQKIPQLDNTVVDVAHNPAATQILAQRLANAPIHKRILAVVGMLADKDIEGTLAPLKTLVDQWYIGSLSGNRGTKADVIMEILQRMTTKSCYNFASVTAAFEKAWEDRREGDQIIVFGSFMTVSEVLLSRMGEIKNDTI